MAFKSLSSVQKLFKDKGFVEVWHTGLACVGTGAVVGIVAFVRGCAVGWEDCLRYQEAVESGGFDPQQEIMVRAWYRRSHPARYSGSASGGSVLPSREL